MRNRYIFFGVLATLSLIVFVFARGGTKSQGAQKRTASTRDFSGVWQVREFQPQIYPDNPPLRPSYAAKFKATDGSTDDPNLGCLPHGIPRLMYVPLPFEIFHVSGRVLIFQEALHQVRQIWVDGRDHPKDLDPSWTGHAVGKWDGDTLVVDTIGMNDKTWLDHAGLPHSDALHVTERIRRPDHDTLIDDFMIDDLKAFTKTWTSQQVYKLRPGWEIHEYVCEENNKYEYQPK